MIRLRVIAVASPIMLYATTVVAKTPAVISAFAYDFVGSTVTTDPSGKSRQQVMMRGHAMAFGDKTRIDVLNAGSATGWMRGSYLLLLDGGHRVYWLTPRLHQYHEIESESFLSGLGAFAGGSNGLISMAASNVHMDAQKVGPGPMIQGHNTTHYRFHQRMDMKTKVFNKTVTTHDESVIDYYYATDVANVTNPFLSSAPSLSQDGAQVFSDDYAKQLHDAVDKLYQGGAPLRTVVCDKSTDDFGRVQTTVTTTEMTNLKQVDVDPLVFEVPLDFSKVSTAYFSVREPRGDEQDALLPPSNIPASPNSAVLRPAASTSMTQAVQRQADKQSSLFPSRGFSN